MDFAAAKRTFCSEGASKKRAPKRKPELLAGMQRNDGSYKTAMVIKAIMVRKDGETYPLCPRCAAQLRCEYQSCCDRCGQTLSWDMSRRMLICFDNR